MQNAIEIKNLRKCYKDIEAVKGIDFSVEKGSFFALLGVNGAGKTTTIQIIATLLKKTSGEVVVNGHRIDIEDHLIRKDIGVVFQGSMLDKHLTVKENIINRGALYGLSVNEVLSRLQDLAQKIGVDDILGRRYGQLSGGQKRRADILRALINRPAILILDEPTTGLDPHTRKCVWDTLRQLKERNELTLFLTTHYMEEAAQADSIVIMDHGQIKASGTPEQLRLAHSRDKLILVSKKTNSLAASLQSKKIGFEIGKDRVTIPLHDSFSALGIVEQIRDHIDGFEVIRGNLDDVFVNLTGRKKGARV